MVSFYAEAWDYFDRNRSLVYGALAVIALVVVGAVGWTFYSSAQADEADELLGGIISTYEQGNYEEALQGTGDQRGLLYIAEEYGGTHAGNMAHFYAADALFQTGQNEQALEHWQAFDKERDLLGAGAYAGMAAVYEEQGNHDEAGSYYQRAAEQYASEATSPQYLMQSARAYEEAGSYGEAREVLEQIEEEYPESGQASQVPIALARIEAKQEA